MVSPMRRSRFVAAGAALVLAFGVAGIAGAASSLSISPGSGQVSDTFTATYQTDARACAGARVRFGWDGQPLADGTLEANWSVSVTSGRRRVRMPSVDTRSTPVGST